MDPASDTAAIIERAKHSIAAARHEREQLREVMREFRRTREELLAESRHRRLNSVTGGYSVTKPQILESAVNGLTNR